MKGTSKLQSRHLSADRPLQRLRGCFLGDNAAVPPAYRVKVEKCASLLTFLMCVNLQHFVTERDIGGKGDSTRVWLQFPLGGVDGLKFRLL